MCIRDRDVTEPALEETREEAPEEEILEQEEEPVSEEIAEEDVYKRQQ